MERNELFQASKASKQYLAKLIDINAYDLVQPFPFWLSCLLPLKRKSFATRRNQTKSCGTITTSKKATVQQARL